MAHKKKWIGLAIVVAVIAVPLVAKSRSKDSGREVEIEKVALHEIKPTILASGTLAFGTEVDLRSELTAKVSEILVREGDTVEKGQLLIKLEPENYKNAIDNNEAALRQAQLEIDRGRASLELQRHEFERTKRMFDAKMVDAAKFDAAKNQLTLAEVALKSSEESVRRTDSSLRDARKNLTRTEIRAPIGGKVVALPIKVGETAIPSTQSMAGAQLLTVADTSGIKAELKVDEGDIARVSTGQRVEVFAAAYPDRAMIGKVDSIALAPIVGQTSRAYKVTVRLEPASDMQLRSGMSCRAEVMLGDGSKKLSIPVEAVLQEEKDGDKKPDNYVLINKAGKVEKRTVKLDIADDRWQGIASGVKADESVIVGPGKTLRDLKNGEAVQGKPRSKKPAETESGVSVQIGMNVAEVGNA